MFDVKGTDLLIAAAVAGVLVTSVQKANADEVYMQVTRTSGDAVPVQTTRTTTTQTTRTTSDPLSTTIITPGTVISPGTVVVSSASVPLTYGESSVVLQTIDQRRSILDKHIVDARTAGTLNEAQAAQLRRELDRIGSEVIYLKAQPNPSLLRAIVVAQDLDHLGLNLKRNVTTVAIVPIIEGSHFTVFNGRIIELDDLAVRRIGLENKILAAQAEGRLNYDQANHLRSQLNAIAATESAYKNNGGLDPKAVKQIYRSFDEVANNLDRATR